MSLHAIDVSPHLEWLSKAEANIRDGIVQNLQQDTQANGQGDGRGHLASIEIRRTRVESLVHKEPKYRRYSCNQAESHK